MGNSCSTQRCGISRGSLAAKPSLSAGIFFGGGGGGGWGGGGGGGGSTNQGDPLSVMLKMVINTPIDTRTADQTRLGLHTL